MKPIDANKLKFELLAIKDKVEPNTQWKDGYISAIDIAVMVVDKQSSIEEHEQEKWIPIVTRIPTEEEKADFYEANGYELCYMVDSEMPYDRQQVLVSIDGYVSEDVWSDEYYNFENFDLEDVDAWMSMPKPYQKKGD